MRTTITKTAFPGLSFSHPFAAKYQGLCAWTGIPIFRGTSVRNTDQGVISEGFTSIWDFRTCDGGVYSTYERLGSPETRIGTLTEGSVAWLMNTSGAIRRFIRRGDTFHEQGTLTPATKSLKQMMRLLKAAYAIRIEVEMEKP